MAQSKIRRQRLIIGLGKSGLSCARFLSRRYPKELFSIVDNRSHPPCLTRFKKEFPNASVHLGPFNTQLLEQAHELILSPGIDLRDPVINKVSTKTGIRPIGDIELFAKNATAPVIAITGTNAKGTVTTLIGDMIKASKKAVKVGGNIGKPALDLLHDKTPDFYVLEISSFQLETTFSLNAKVATILNISPDHLNRHRTLENYIKIKQKIYNNCEIAVYNHDDPQTYPHKLHTPKLIIYYSLDPINPNSNQFCLKTYHQKIYFAKGNQLLLPVDKLFIKGKHNWANALAALTIGNAIHLPLDIMLATLSQFKGLTHRCQWIKEINGAAWYNDSKATNVGATQAALQGLGPSIKGKIILIAGGLGKNADFNPLRYFIKKFVKTIILIGEDATLLKKTFENDTFTKLAQNLSHAVSIAQKISSPGDAVLLSPACASMDMFKNYEERGNIFIKLVQGIS